MVADMFASTEHNLCPKELGMSRQKTWHFYVQMHTHVILLLTKWDSFMRKMQELFYQFYDTLMNYCGKAFLSWSLQSVLLTKQTPVPAILFITQKVKEEQQVLRFLARSIKPLVPWLNNEKWKKTGKKTQCPFAKVIFHLNQCNWKRMNRLIIAF